MDLKGVNDPTTQPFNGQKAEPVQISQNIQKSRASSPIAASTAHTNTHPATGSVSLGSLRQVGNPSQARPIQQAHNPTKGPATKGIHLVSFLKNIFAKMFGGDTKRAERPAPAARPLSFQMEENRHQSFLEGLRGEGFGRHLNSDRKSLKGRLQDIVKYDENPMIRGEANWLLGKIAEKDGDVAGAEKLYKAAVADGYVPKDNAAQLVKANAVIDHGMAMLLQRAEAKDKSMDGIFRVTALGSEVDKFQDAVGKMPLMDGDAHASIQERLADSDSSLVGEAILRMVRTSSPTQRGGLDTSLIPSNQYAEVLNIIRSSKNEDERVEGFKTLLAAIPSENRETLQKLMGHLGKLAEHSGVTQMGASNLAMVFASNILVPPNGTDPSEEMANMRTGIQAMQFLIEHRDQIFTS